MQAATDSAPIPGGRVREWVGCVADEASAAGVELADAVEIPAHVAEAAKTRRSAWNADRALPQLPRTPTRAT